MQKVKRKSDDNGLTEAKKKKVEFAKPEKDAERTAVTKKFEGKKPGKDFQKGETTGVNGTGKKFEGKSRKNFNKDGSKGVKKFNKPGNFKGKPNFSKDNKFTKGENGTEEKPKWSEMKKEKKQLRIVRRKAKATAEVFEISHKAKLLSAQIQRKVVKPEFKLASCKELHKLLKGQYKSIALTHDLSRVIQVLLKHGPEDVKNEISEELLDIMVQMVQSKYAQHAVKRILKYGTDFIRHEVIKKFYGHIVSLAAHTISAPVLDFAYGEFATKKEKIHMQQEFYGEIYKNTKDDKVKTLSDAYKGSPEMKAAILQSCKANVQRILDKNLHDGELLHSVLYDYIRECSPEDRVELVSTLSPLIVPLSNSLPGVNTACMCVWLGTNKDKKTILKVVKEHAVPLSKHKTGYRLLITIFDSVDDTVLVKKAIVSTLANNLQDIAKDHWGNMTLHWLVKPKDPTIFHPSFIKFLEEGAKSGTSKKDADIRIAELREAILPVLTKDMQENPQFWLSSKILMLLAVAVLSIESSQDILQALAKEICQAVWQVSVNGKDILAVEDAGIHMCLKKLAALDKDKSDCTLGEAICGHLNEETIKKWLPTNRGCFFLLKLIESNNEDVSKKITKKIKPHAGFLKQQTSEGAKLLLQKVQK
ncbi:protein penguin [Pectinophora gossypiella]|uniref:protein penguin n=1 Tax=Pectinophora gossypiella TaxID=13191 RepID=UPI00214F2742|nr:protein penguin [Pectinophora gossypiella]